MILFKYFSSTIAPCPGVVGTVSVPSEFNSNGFSTISLLKYLLFAIMSPGNVNPGRQARQTFKARPTPCLHHTPAPDDNFIFSAKMMNDGGIYNTFNSSRLNVYNSACIHNQCLFPLMFLKMSDSSPGCIISFFRIRGARTSCCIEKTVDEVSSI